MYPPIHCSHICIYVLMIFAVSWYVVNCMDMVLKQFSKCVSHPIPGIRAIQYDMFNVYRFSHVFNLRKIYRISMDNITIYQTVYDVKS
jgi:hypothetical protein